MTSVDDNELTSPERIALKYIRDAKRKGSKELGLRHLGLSMVPNQIIELSELVSLDLGDNNVTSLPSFLFSLPRLQYINIWNNRLKVFPLEINRNQTLISLDLGNNELLTLPSSIALLTNLEKLYISNNQITALPPEIGQLTKLRTLSASSNNLTTLPPEIKLLTKLNSLDLRFNMLPIPIEILEKINEPGAILTSYLGKRRSLNEVKVLVVGQGGVGKTSLVRRLIYEQFYKDEGKTEGIAINNLDIPLVNLVSPEYPATFKNNQGRQKNNLNSSVRLNIWDFGGQEIMHTTHQFFLTRRSLYLLILDSRLTQEENRVEYWLKLIQTFGGDSPVIIVGNKVDIQPLDIDKRGLKKRYPSIKSILEVSAANGKGISELKQVISDEVIDLPHIHDQLLRSWFKIKDSLTKMEENYITHDHNTFNYASNTI